MYPHDPPICGHWEPTDDGFVTTILIKFIDVPQLGMVTPNISKESLCLRGTFVTVPITALLPCSARVVP
jgi:hypothetical protein